MFMFLWFLKAEACIPIPESNKVPVISMLEKAAAILPFIQHKLFVSFLSGYFWFFLN